MIANHKGEIPFFILLLPFLLGIGLGIDVLSAARLTWLLIILFSLCCIFILFNVYYNRLGLYKYRWLGGSLMCFILFFFGWIMVVRYNELNNAAHFSKIPAGYLIVQINSEPYSKNGILRFTADVPQNVNNGTASATRGTLLVAIKDSAAKNIYYGDQLLIPAKYNPVDPPFNPAEFNYKRYLANQNIFYQAFLFPKQFVVLATNRGNPVVAYSLRLRQRLVEKLKRS